MIIPSSDTISASCTDGVWAPLGSLIFDFSEVMESGGRVSVNHKLEFLALLQKSLGDLEEQEPETFCEVFTSVSLCACVFCPQTSLHLPLSPPVSFPLAS